MPSGTGTVLVPKIATFGPIIASLTANPTKAKLTVPTTIVGDINDYKLAVGTSEFHDSTITWEEVTNDTLHTFSTVNGRFVWYRIASLNETITVPDRGVTDTPIKLEIV